MSRPPHPDATSLLTLRYRDDAERDRIMRCFRTDDPKLSSGRGDRLFVYAGGALAISVVCTIDEANKVCHLEGTLYDPVEKTYSVLKDGNGSEKNLTLAKRLCLFVLKQEGMLTAEEVKALTSTMKLPFETLLPRKSSKRKLPEKNPELCSLFTRIVDRSEPDWIALEGGSKPNRIAAIRHFSSIAKPVQISEDEQENMVVVRLPHGNSAGIARPRQVGSDVDFSTPIQLVAEPGGVLRAKLTAEGQPMPVRHPPNLHACKQSIVRQLDAERLCTVQMVRKMGLPVAEQEPESQGKSSLRF